VACLGLPNPRAHLFSEQSSPWHLPCVHTYLGAKSTKESLHTGEDGHIQLHCVQSLTFKRWFFFPSALQSVGDGGRPQRATIFISYRNDCSGGHLAFSKTDSIVAALFVVVKPGLSAWWEHEGSRPHSPRPVLGVFLQTPTGPRL